MSGRWRQSAAARDCVKSRFFENAVEQNQWFAKSARSKNGVLTQSGALFGQVYASGTVLAFSALEMRLGG